MYLLKCGFYEEIFTCIKCVLTVETMIFKGLLFTNYFLFNKEIELIYNEPDNVPFIRIGIKKGDI